MSPKAKESPDVSTAAAVPVERKKYDRLYRNPKLEMIPRFAAVVLELFHIPFGEKDNPKSQYYWVGRGRDADTNGYLLVDLYRDLHSEVPNFRILRDGTVLQMRPVDPPAPQKTE